MKMIFGLLAESLSLFLMAAREFSTENRANRMEKASFNLIFRLLAFL
jgi:hypothetical protein